MFPPKTFDNFSPEGGCSEGLDAFRFSSEYTISIPPHNVRLLLLHSDNPYYYSCVLTVISNFKLATLFFAAKPFYTLCGRQKITSTTGVPKWGYRGIHHDGILSEYMPETEVLSNFNILQLDIVQVLWNLYKLRVSQVHQIPREIPHNNLFLAKTLFDCFQ